MNPRKMPVLGIGWELLMGDKEENGQSVIKIVLIGFAIFML